MLVALPVLEPDAAAGQRRLEHHRRADHVVGFAISPHRPSPDPAKGAGNLTPANAAVTQKTTPEFRRVR